MSPETDVRVRFAPSPTGALHVGGARTAIFNWLFARKHGGEFLLRIEDTDVERSEDSMVDEILDGLDWLGLHPDEDPIYQSENFEYYEQTVDRLLENDLAYRCFCTPEELEVRRKQAGESRDAYQYDGRCRQLTAAEVRNRLEDGDQFAVRFKTPERWINFKDRVYKKISVHSGEIDDFVLQRRDGTPTYQLAVVVDDHSMGITHVIRGKDHLSNTPKQILLYQALGYDVPRFAHLPLIVGADGKQLSKRHGATAVTEFREEGYLPTAMVNYLSLLGWSPKGNEEIFLPDDLIRRFDLLQVSKDDATFDEAKLRWVNGHHFSLWSTEDLIPLVKPVLEQAGLLDARKNGDYIFQVVGLLKTRVKSLEDFAVQGRYFWEDPQEYDSGAVERFWPEKQVNHRMDAWVNYLEGVEDFSSDNLENALRGFAEELGVEAADLIHPTRVAMTGTGESPGVFAVMSLLGKETLIRRLRAAIEQLPG